MGMLTDYMYFNMAYHDKGRRKWGGISQENIADSKLDKKKLLVMPGGGNRAPPQPLYRPGSGPLRKTGRSTDDFDNDNSNLEKSKSTSVQYRLKQPHQYNNPHQVPKNSVQPPQVDSVSTSLSDLHISYNKNNSHENELRGSSKNIHSSGDSCRRKMKKPEQLLYVPKKVKEAQAERDVANKSPQGDWEREDNRDWDTQSNRSHRNDGGQRNRPNPAGNHNEVGNRNRDDYGKRYSGNRRNRYPDEKEERWRSDSPMSARNFSQSNRRDNTHEVRQVSNERKVARGDDVVTGYSSQGSEPRFTRSSNSNDVNRTRDTRSVEPLGYRDKFQGRPPTGRKGSTNEITVRKNVKITDLPPRFQKKYLMENGLVPNTQGNSEDGWNGTTVTFQHSQGMQTLHYVPASATQSNWSNTVPARGRGRGRCRHEESEQPSVFRPVTPDQYSAPSSRSHTPSQDYMNRSYDRRGSNSTMYTSMESLSRVDSILMPPPRSMSPAMPVTNSRCQPSPDNQRKGVSSPTIGSQHRTYPSSQRNNNAYESSSSYEKRNSKQPSCVSPVKNEGFSALADLPADRTLDWGEDVETWERMDSDRLSRSSSVLSLRENPSSLSYNQPSSGGGGGGGGGGGAGTGTAGGGGGSGGGGGGGIRRSHRKKKREKKHGGSDRASSKDKDKIRTISRERENSQHNRENDNYNNNQKSSSNNNRRYEGRRRERRIHSRENSKDRNYRGSRNYEDFHRRSSEHNSEENWRSGRKMSICDSDDGRRTPNLHSHPIPQSNACNVSSSVRQISPTRISSNAQQPPGVLVLPENSQSAINVTSPPRPQQSGPLSSSSSSQPQRILYDPKNPNRPIVVTSPGSRAVLPPRENETPLQGSSIPTFQSHPIPAVLPGFQGAQMESTLPTSFITDQFGNMRPSWYDPYSDSFRSAKNPYLLLDIERADLELQFILSSGGLTSNWERVSYIRHFLQKGLQILLEQDIKFCQAENVEQHFWKILFYNLIEMLRKGMPKENGETRENCKKIMLSVVDEGTVYLENLLSVLENTYKFKIDTFLVSSAPPKGLGVLGLALVSAQKIFLFLGDLARYKEQVNETTNYGKSRQWYLKAQQINPKNGRPYNQLALLAHYARRKLDAVYFYMRSLMASNPFHSARESLIALFDENRKKYESMERKRKEEREWKERARMKEKEGANNIGGNLRRETWVHPGGRRVRRTTATTKESRLAHSDLEELAQLTSVEVNKRFVTSYLHVHGKLITKIGMETFQEAGIQMLREFRALLQHSPLPLPGTRLLQLLALNMFAIETTQLKDSQMEQGYRSEVQERALVVSLQMFSLILERGVALLKAQLEAEEKPRLIIDEDMQVLLPAIKIWCDWMLCHSTVWNPPPSCTDYRVGPPGDAWSRLATMVNLLEKLEYDRKLVIQAEDAVGREDDLELIRLPEDTTLSGFTPLMSNPQDPCYSEKNEDPELAQVCLRINKVLFFGQEFLCGLETPVLKLQKSETGVSEYVSVAEASSASTPSSPPEQSDSELMIESFSEGEDETTTSSSSSSLRKLHAEIPDVTAAPGEIRSLIERKEELERRQRKQDRHRQRVQAILQNSSVSVEIEVRPRQLVPDTNCFIDYLPQLQSITKAVSGAQPLYTLMVPIVVLNELEGLARGGEGRDTTPASRATLNPEHVARVAESAKSALAFVRSKNPAVRSLTTRGTVLTTSTFTVEEDVSQDGLTSNDDRILATCLSLCKSSGSNKDHICTEEGQPRRLRREVVLLTEDRNLRVKALARDVPVREVPDFMEWAGLG